MRTVRLAREGEAEQVQNIYNAGRNAEWLGGFTLLEPIRSKIAAGNSAVVVEDGEIIACDETSGDRDNPLRRKLQLVGCREDKKRSGCATALYTFWSLHCMLEGRDQMLDSIVGDNPYMPHFLPQMGFHLAINQRGKVRRHHDLNLWSGHPGEASSRGLWKLKELDDSYSFEIEQTEKMIKNIQSNVALLKRAGRVEDAGRLLVDVHLAEEQISVH